MDSKTTDSIEARLNELRTKALKAIKIYSSAEHPVFIPDSMISEAVRAAEDNVSQLLRNAVSGASAISVAPEAFLLARDAVAAHLLDLQRRIEQGRGVLLPRDTLKLINERFAAVSERAYQNLENYRTSFSGSINQGGRRPKWDWEGALSHLVAVANTPDGLPINMERGDQAKLVKIISEWFVQKTGESPDERDIKKLAKKVIEAISNPRKGGNQFPPLIP